MHSKASCIAGKKKKKKFKSIWLNLAGCSCCCFAFVPPLDSACDELGGILRVQLFSFNYMRIFAHGYSCSAACLQSVRQLHPDFKNPNVSRPTFTELKLFGLVGWLVGWFGFVGWLVCWLV